MILLQPSSLLTSGKKSLIDLKLNIEARKKLVNMAVLHGFLVVVALVGGFPFACVDDVEILLNFFNELKYLVVESSSRRISPTQFQSQFKNLRLVVQVGNRSSEFHPEVRRVRRQGSYIYEEFLSTGGTDVKVYTVGPEYAHAEARKSPVVDGVVMRNPDGKEVRYPVLLTLAEKQIARDVCVAFGQAVCGFDLLRCEGRSYVCDVNGWSFVKNSYKYYDDAACVLRKIVLDAKAPHLSTAIPPILPWMVHEPVQPSEGLPRQGSGIIGNFGQSEELRCVIAIIHHGDRTPKQKVKLKVTEEKLLNLMLKYNG